MNIQPPIGIKFFEINVSLSKAGICPNCATKTLEFKTTYEVAQIWQCSNENCKVVVALGKT